MRISSKTLSKFSLCISIYLYPNTVDIIPKAAVKLLQSLSQEYTISSWRIQGSPNLALSFKLASTADVTVKWARDIIDLSHPAADIEIHQGNLYGMTECTGMNSDNVASNYLDLIRTTADKIDNSKLILE